MLVFLFAGFFLPLSPLCERGLWLAPPTYFSYFSLTRECCKTRPQRKRKPPLTQERAKKKTRTRHKHFVRARGVLLFLIGSPLPQKSFIER